MKILKSSLTCVCLKEIPQRFVIILECDVEWMADNVLKKQETILRFDHNIDTLSVFARCPLSQLSLSSLFLGSPYLFPQHVNFLWLSDHFGPTSQIFRHYFFRVSSGISTFLRCELRVAIVSLSIVLPEEIGTSLRKNPRKETSKKK